ncbi:hypothetical protein EYF80_038760 [Liparis tanakae]|uniref:Uncharacterized protein n=1 Tax=Liparis tanakae TaxID=230148 RepID=A0A4Z2GCP3_9TELE|nr:hypothetical protein EYF80_038760 [Liparis tanakae]
MTTHRGSEARPVQLLATAGSDVANSAGIGRPEDRRFEPATLPRALGLGAGTSGVLSTPPLSPEDRWRDTRTRFMKRKKRFRGSRRPITGRGGRGGRGGRREAEAITPGGIIGVLMRTQKTFLHISLEAVTREQRDSCYHFMNSMIPLTKATGRGPEDLSSR